MLQNPGVLEDDYDVQGVIGRCVPATDGGEQEAVENRVFLLPRTYARVGGSWVAVRGLGVHFPPRMRGRWVVNPSRGAFGTVYRAVHKRTGEAVAVKLMDRRVIKAASIAREWTALERIGKSPYVVQYKGAYKTPVSVAFVLELYVSAARAFATALVAQTCGGRVLTAAGVWLRFFFRWSRHAD